MNRSRCLFALIAALALSQMAPGFGAAATRPLSKTSITIVTSNTDTITAVLRALRRAIELEAHDPKDAEAAFFEYITKVGGKQALSEKIRHTAWVNNEAAFPKTLIITPSAIDKGRTLLGIPASVSDEQMLSMELARKVMDEKL